MTIKTIINDTIELQGTHEMNLIEDSFYVKGTHLLVDKDEQNEIDEYMDNNKIYNVKVIKNNISGDNILADMDYSESDFNEFVISKIYNNLSGYIIWAFKAY